jgi:ABC-type transporter Mla MlaB component
MAKKEDKGLIGFDPLAWMNNEDEDSTKQLETETTGENKKQPEKVDVSEEISNEEVDVETKPSVNPAAQQTENETDDLKITLDATLNIQNVTELYEQLSKRLNNQDIIEIDASAVVSIDTATLQLLIVLKQEAVKLHKEVIIDFPSDQFIEASELLGLDKMLEVDQAAAGFF